MKVFLDTNVLVSALATRGLCAELFEFVLAEQSLLTSTAVLEELERNLAAKFRLPRALVKESVVFLQQNATLVPEGAAPLSGIPDPADGQILASAIQGGSDVFVTGDQELRKFAKTLALPVLSPREFWDRYIDPAT